MMEKAVLDAVAAGWRVRSVGESMAILDHPGTPELSAGFHIINVVGVLGSCGLWLLVYLAVWAVHESKSRPAKTLILREVAGKIAHQITEES